MNLKQIVPGLAGTLRSDAGATPARAEAALPSAAPAAAPPAVSVNVSGLGAAPLAAAGPSELSDAELLAELRARVERGEFRIDYDGLARSLIEDAVLAIGSRAGR